MKVLLQNLGIKVLPILINCIFKTLKFKIHNYQHLEKENCVLMFWHGTMLAGWYILKDRNVCGVVSQSKDGEILSRLLMKWGYELIRGSSSRESKEVMKLMVETLRNGTYLAITPDGPKGPALKMKIGGLIASVRAKKPIVLCGVYYDKKFIFNSWDKFQLPKLFSCVNVILSEPKNFPDGLSREDYEQIRQKLEDELIELQSKAATLP